jgi:hypothetical protein
MSCLSFYFLVKYYSGGNIRDSKVGLACDSSCGEHKFVQFLVESPEGKIKHEGHLSREMTLKSILNDWLGGLEGG